MPPDLPIAAPVTGSSEVLADLARRWTRARAAALRTLVPDAPSDTTEGALLDVAWSVDPDGVSRRVFDNSRVLGQGFSRVSGWDLTLPDLVAVLPRLGAPCVAGGCARVAGGAAARTERAPCPEVRRAWCVYWREALLGMVNGLSSSVWFSRVRNPASGADRCVDLLHVDPWSPLRFDPVPDALAPVIDRVAGELLRQAPGADVHILGMADGALHVRVESSLHEQLGARFARALQRALPDLELRDASARSVLSPSSSTARSTPCPTQTPGARS